MLVGILAWGSENVRRLEEFATVRDVWNVRSSLNRFYLLRGMRVAERYTAELKRLRPSLPPRSTVYFAGIPAQVSFQAGDGPLVRWVYRDTSVKSYYLSSFTADRPRRGPDIFVEARGDSLNELTGPDLLRRVAFRLILTEDAAAARHALELSVARDREDLVAWYWLALVHLTDGDGVRAREALARAHVAAEEGPTPEIPGVLELWRAGRTDAAVRVMMAAAARHGLDPNAHALLADLTLAHEPSRIQGAVEAFAVRVLAPGDASAWRRWAAVQMVFAHDEQASRSLERYFALGGREAERDTEAIHWRERLDRIVPRPDWGRHRSSPEKHP